MESQDPPVVSNTAEPAAPGFARRAAEAFKKAVWRSEPDADLAGAVATVATLTDRVKKYLPSADVQKIKDAFRFSDEAHLGQFRRSGAPYITHPLAVAEILTDWRLDGAAIQAALLHDVIEDCGVEQSQLIERFGSTVAELVDGVSKLDRLQFSSTEQAQAENFRKMLLAMARDVRVMLIKLADRLHNMRTLGAVDSERRRRIARETLEIYAPIAHRLGLNTLFRELEELSFQHLYPLRYQVLNRAVLAARGNRREVLGKMTQAVRKSLTDAKLRAEVQGREKTVYGIYRKMADKHLSFSQVLDIYGFRVVIDSVAQCYLALGTLHSLYKPVPGKFKDYIAIPKVNGYQSLHTTLIGPYGTPVEFQIRTKDMHHVAESGVAAHWLYKEDDSDLSELQSRTHQWLQSLLEIQRQTGDSNEFLEHIKVDLFPDKVYIFTPKGLIVALPRDATPVDFAYSIHTDVGNKTVAARINNEIQPLHTVLKNGDMVEIVTGPEAKPNPAWLSFVRTGKARSEIRHFLRTMKFDESVELGEQLLAQAAQQFNLQLGDVADEQWAHVLSQSDTGSRQDLLADIGLGRKLPAVVARQLALGSSVEGETAQSAGPVSQASQVPVVVRGTEGMAVQMASCCHPIPDDPIVGHIRKGQGLAVHQADCLHAQRSRRADPERWIELQWAKDTASHFTVGIDVRALNERGVLGRIAVAIAEAESNILNVHLEDEDAKLALIRFKIQVHDRVHLARVIRSLRRVKNVQQILRPRTGGSSTRTLAHDLA